MKRQLVCLLAGAAIIALTVCSAEPPPRAPEVLAGWWRGNLHTHSLWSDGDDYPEMIAEWYKQQGYHFLALSDHNILLDGEKWIEAEKSKGGLAALEKYRARFGAKWVEERVKDGRREVRLKTLRDFATFLNEHGRFLMVPSEEISDKVGKAPIHVNATNIAELIKPPGGATVVECMQNNVDAVLEQRRRTGQPMFPHINHPNFGWAITAEELAQVRGEKFFEVYNGHPLVHPYGDATHASSERIWDIVLTKRLESGLGVMYGVAVDDSHSYHKFDIKQSNAGRGWVVVRAQGLSAASIVAAMEAGDFYASTGVKLKDVRCDGRTMTVEIDAEPGVTYSTQFIGTRKNYDRRTEPVAAADGKPLPVTLRYSVELGRVLGDDQRAKASYTMFGDELYVRAKVTSSKLQMNPYAEGDVEVAWTQPWVR